MKVILMEEDAAFLAALLLGGMVSHTFGLLVLTAWVCRRVCGFFDAAY